MKRFFAFLITLTVICAVPAAADQSDVVTVVGTELARLNQSSRMNIQVTYATSGGSEIDSAGNVIVDTTQLERIQRTASVKQFQAMVRLILAHEFAHVLQFQRYGKSSVLETSGEARQVYEAQADMLAGQYLVPTLTSQNGAEAQEAFEDALNVMSDLGVETGGAQYADHPTRDERMTAVRLGMASGTMMALLQAAKAPGADPRYLTAAQVLAQRLDIPGVVDAMAWSLLESQKVIHSHAAQLASLHLSHPTVNWNTSADSPFVSYAFTYTNTGDLVLHVDLNVQCWSAPRSNPSDLRHSQLWGSARDQFTIAPGQQHTVRGQLNWGGGATATLMPRLLWPPRPGSLITVTD